VHLSQRIFGQVVQVPSKPWTIASGFLVAFDGVMKHLRTTHLGASCVGYHVWSGNLQEMMAGVLSIKLAGCAVPVKLSGPNMEVGDWEWWVAGRF